MGSVKGLKGRLAGLTTGKPTDDLQRSIERLQHSFQQDPMEVLLVASHEQSYFGPAPPGCQLGRREWTVVFDDPAVSEDRISKLERDFTKFKADASKDAVYLGKPAVINLASQVLLFAVGEQPRPASTASYFTNRCNRSDPALMGFVNDLGIMEARSFANLADGVITRRNQTLHFADWNSVEDAVTKCVEFVSRHPDLRIECRRECIVLDSFHLIRQHFA